MSAAQVARRVGPSTPSGSAERLGSFGAGDDRSDREAMAEAAAHAAPQVRYVVMSDGSQRGSGATAGAGAGVGAGAGFWTTAEDPWRWPKRAAARAAVAACGFQQPEPFWPSSGTSAPPPSPRLDALGLGVGLHRERPLSATARALSPVESEDERCVAEPRSRASAERQPGTTTATEAAETTSERAPASRHSRRRRTHSRSTERKKRSDSARGHSQPHQVHAKPTDASQPNARSGASPEHQRPRSAGEELQGAAKAHGQPQQPHRPRQPPRTSPRGLGLSGRVHYRREDTYIVAVPSNPALAVGPRDAGGDADAGAGGGGGGRGGCDGSPGGGGEGGGGRGGAGGDSPGDLALRLAHASRSACTSEESLKRRPSTANATCEGRRSCEAPERVATSASAEALTGGARDAHADAGVARSDSKCKQQLVRVQSACGDAGAASTPASGPHRAPRVGLVSVSSWKLHDGLAWELWYEQKLKEEQERRRREERRRKMMQAQEEARKQEEERKKVLEEENRKKWLERKKKQEEEERKKLERQKKMAERKEQEEAQRNEQRLRFCMEYMRKANERKEEMKKAEAQQRALKDRLREEAEHRRRELKERSLEQWKHRAARHAKPITGCIFQRDVQPKAPKAAIDFINPEPWQF